MAEKIPWPFTRLYTRLTSRVFVKWFRRIVEDIERKQISGTILDIGTGPGRLPVEIVKRIVSFKVIGIDLSEDMIRIATKNASMDGLADRVDFRGGNAYHTGYDDDSIDLVVSTGVFHHLKEPAKAFNEIHRIMKPGGEAWIYDGRKDATRAEFEETVRILGVEEDLPLPLWVVQKIWPHMHVGCKTEVYISGKIGQAIKESPFRSYHINIEGAYVRIELKKA